MTGVYLLGASGPMRAILRVNWPDLVPFHRETKSNDGTFCPARTALAPRLSGRDRVCHRAHHPRRIPRSDPRFRHAPEVSDNPSNRRSRLHIGCQQISSLLQNDDPGGLAGSVKGSSSRKTAMRRKSHCSKQRSRGLLQCSRVCQASVIQLQ